MREKQAEWFKAHIVPVAIAAVLIVAVLVAVVVTQNGDSEPANGTTLAAQTAAAATEAPEPTEPATQASTTAPTTQATRATVSAQSSGSSQAAPAAETAATRTDSDKTVYYPQSLTSSNRKYPVIVWANGTGCATSTYSGLLEIFAEAGYIVVADASMMTADGTAQRDSIDYILGEATRSGSPFYNKVDTANIGAAGHSQGGRSAVNAAQEDSRIRCVLSIAGASSADEARRLNTPIFFMTGTADAIVLSSMWVEPSYDAVTGRAVYASLTGGVHTTCMTNPTQISGYAVEWFDAYLKNDSAARNTFAAGGALANDSDWQDFMCKN